jgi:hypothetical protein
MKVLASRIVEEVKTAGHCAIYEAELEEFWPATVDNREAKISSFAKDHGLRLGFYKAGLCAIFDEDPTSTTSVVASGSSADSGCP